MMSELRWSREDAELTRDGIEVASLELSAMDQVALDISREFCIFTTPSEFTHH